MEAALVARRKNLGGGAWILYQPGWLAPEEATALQGALTEQVPWEHRSISMFGKEILQPRLIGWGGELPYRYSGQTLPPRAVLPVLEPVWARVVEALGVPFNHLLPHTVRVVPELIVVLASHKAARRLFPNHLPSSLLLNARKGSFGRQLLWKVCSHLQPASKKCQNRMDFRQNLHKASQAPGGLWGSMLASHLVRH